MASSRRTGLQDTELENLLYDSEGDFIPSDDDDPEFNPTIDDEHVSSESESDQDEVRSTAASVRIPSDSSIIRSSRGRSRGRTRGYGRGRGSHGNVFDSSPATSSASTAAGPLLIWSEKTFVPKETHLLEPAYIETDTTNFTICEYFNRYIDDEFVNLIVDKTNQSFVHKTGKSLNFNLRECYTYIGCTFVMATINYPILRMYWEKKWRIDIIANAISRRRFVELRNSLKLVFDVDISAENRAVDKLWRVRPLIEKVQMGCRTEVKEKCMSIDEMIIPFTGACGIKQYCPGKPNPVGLKAFVLANPNGMVCDLTIYQGKTTYPDLENTQFTLGEKAVLTLAEALVPGHTLYFDRYFTSEKLVSELKVRGIGCSGTLMKNKVPKDARDYLLDDKAMKLRGRGSSQVLVHQNNELALTKWYDNKPVLLLSSVEAKDNEDECRRWCKQTSRYITVKRPQVVRKYNQNMGGVDLADRLLAVCPNRYRTKKWTQRFISHLLDLVVGNIWIRYKQDQLQKNIRKSQILQLRAFKLKLGENLIRKEELDSSDSNEDIETVSTSQKRKRGLPAVELPPKKKRSHHAKHLPDFLSQGKCRQCHVNKTFFSCRDCKVRLCLTKKRNCFIEFHTTDAN